MAVVGVTLREQREDAGDGDLEEAIVPAMVSVFGEKWYKMLAKKHILRTTLKLVLGLRENEELGGSGSGRWQG